MRIDISCYGANAARIHALAGDFELRSPMDVHAWYRKEWLAIAGTIGFTAQLAAALAPQRAVRDRLAAIQQAGLTAFAAWLRTQAPSLSDSHAKAQESVLVELAARDPAELWRVTVDPTGSPTTRSSDPPARLALSHVVLSSLALSLVGTAVLVWRARA